MIIVTTPMCENILKIAGITDYKVNKHPDEEEGDLAILLSESKVKMNSLPIKLNTFSQIRESIIEVARYSPEGSLSQEKLDDLFDKYNKNYNLDKRVKVYSEFLKDIACDMGLVLDDENYEYVIYPDYLKEEINEKDNIKLIEIPTHSNVSADPLERCAMRYEQIENFINNKNYI